jgi:hypothetical protein
VNADDALRPLLEHSPLPDDDDLSDELIARYDEVRRFFLDHPIRGRSVLSSTRSGTGAGSACISSSIRMSAAQPPMPCRSPETGRRLSELRSKR